MLGVHTEHGLCSEFRGKIWDHPNFPKKVCCSWHVSLNQLAPSQQIPKIAKQMNDGVILCFHTSFFVKTSVCFALINDSASPASPQGRLLLREAPCFRNPRKPKWCTHHRRLLLPLLAGASPRLLVFRYSDGVSTHIPPMAHRLCSISSAKQNRKKNGFGASSCTTFL